MFLNLTSLSFLDEMFYHLPFPDLLQLEKLQEKYTNTADVVKFLSEVHADLVQPRAIEGLPEGYVEYVETEMTSRGISNPARSSKCSRRERNRTHKLALFNLFKRCRQPASWFGAQCTRLDLVRFSTHPIS